MLFEWSNLAWLIHDFINKQVLASTAHCPVTLVSIHFPAVLGTVATCSSQVIRRATSGK
jgi:hypothetical protein